MTAAAMSVIGGLAAVPANGNFLAVWERTDRPVAEGLAIRTWMWGPEAFTGALQEPYAESPGGQRTVQYFDKARMEITDPNGDPSSEWYVTNGLLVVELTTGQLQTGNASFEDRAAAQVNVAGDADDTSGPTYATFNAVLNQAPLAVGATITQRIGRDGSVTDDPSLAAQGISTAILDDATHHTIATPFWEFMNSSGLVYEGGQFIQDALFQNAYFATGRPITEPFWATVKVGGTFKLVLMQCFERRCLTFTPDNAPEWRVEAGNVGRHYYEWRSGQGAPPPPPPPPPPGEQPVTFGDGMYFIGDDIPAGTYRNSSSSDGCYWERLSGLSGDVDDINANSFSFYRQVVTIAASDLAFGAEGCGTWTSDLSTITSSPTAAFGDGIWIVGVDIAPGIWRNSDSSDGCYWARLDDFSGELEDINDNEFTEAPQIVSVQPGDAGFESSGCGNWTFDSATGCELSIDAPTNAQPHRIDGLLND